jgi:hypothetical protein
MSSSRIQRADRQVRLRPDDLGIGSVRPDDAPGLGPDDLGIGIVRPDDAPGLGPDDSRAQESKRGPR